MSDYLTHDPSACSIANCQYPQCRLPREARRFRSSSEQDYRARTLSARQQDAAASAYFGDLLGPAGAPLLNSLLVGVVDGAIFTYENYR